MALIDAPAIFRLLLVRFSHQGVDPSQPLVRLSYTKLLDGMREVGANFGLDLRTVTTHSFVMAPRLPYF